MPEFSDRLVGELIDAVKAALKKEQSERLRDVYLVGDIDKDTARSAIERIRELASESRSPITLYLNTAGGNVADGTEVAIVVQGMAYSMGSVVLQAASTGRRLCFPHAWIMIHEPAKWAGWQSTTAAAQHLDRLKQMQSQIYRILSARSGKPLRQIIRDTKRNDFYLDATRALEYGLVDQVLGVTHASTPVIPESVERFPQSPTPTSAELPQADAAAAVEPSPPPTEGDPTAESETGSRAK
jgi:ATP-dependent Clp protease protease subunit